MPERLDPLSSGASKYSVAHHVARYSFASSQVGGKVVLDCACGVGYGSYLMRIQGRAALVIGVDRSVEAIARARRYSATGVEYLVADATALPFRKGAFHLAVSFESIEHIRDQRGFMKEIARVLRPGASLYLSTPDPLLQRMIWGSNPYHTKEPEVRELMSLLSADFEDLEWYGQHFTSLLQAVLSSRLVRSFRQKVVQPNGTDLPFLLSSADPIRFYPSSRLLRWRRPLFVIVKCVRRR